MSISLLVLKWHHFQENIFLLSDFSEIKRRLKLIFTKLNLFIYSKSEYKKDIILKMMPFEK